MWETRVRSLGREDALEKVMATHSSTLAWKIHGWRNVVGYSSWGRKESDMTEQLHFLSLRYYIAQAPSLIYTALDVLSTSFHQVTPLSCITYIKSLILASINFSFGS